MAGGSALRRGCRFCSEPLSQTMIDLGMSPLCESFLDAAQLEDPEPFYPLRVRVCHRCFLVQVEQDVSPAEIFSQYAYFSSYSSSWLEHARDYCDQMIKRFSIGPADQVVEIASNDGYLLKWFAQRGISVLGVEPAANIAKVAEEHGIPTRARFFDADAARELAAEGIRADLLVANNVLAQAPDLSSFVEGLAIALSADGVLTLEFQHLLRLLERNEFDTIYHEHYSYFSLGTAAQILGAYGLEVFDVDELATHGGSLRVYARHRGSPDRQISDRVGRVLAAEDEAGLGRPEVYAAFGQRAGRTMLQLRALLSDIKRDGGTIVGYGAPGKGSALLNYCDIGTDLVDYTVDRNPYKQGKFLPGTHIPVLAPEAIDHTKPDYILILPWNLKDEIVAQLSAARDWGARFIVPIPEPEVVG